MREHFRASRLAAWRSRVPVALLAPALTFGIFIALPLISAAQGVSISPTSMVIYAHGRLAGEGDFLITNNGASTVTVSYAYFSNGTWFSVTENDCSTLDPGQQCYITVDYDPGNVCIGQQQDTLDVYTSGGTLHAGVTGRQTDCVS